MARRINPCSECGVQPEASGTYYWQLKCPKCGKARTSIWSEAKVVREWNQSNPKPPTKKGK